MLPSQLRSLVGGEGLRASVLPRLKHSAIYDNPWTRRLLTASPLAAHLLENAYRRVLSRVLVREAARDAGDAVARLAALRARFPGAPGDCDEAPIFLLAAGWRSGSTLVQRALTSGGDAMIWGEPFARAGVVPRLLDQLRCFTAEWPPADYFVDRFDGDMSGQWIANTYPASPDLIAAHRAFLLRLLAAPARAAGYRDWGLKEVRLDGSHALYLKMLFPAAKFIFLVRDPLASFASFRHYIKSDFVDWPRGPVLTAAEFGRMWRAQVESFAAVRGAVDAFWLHYEDYLTDAMVHEALCAHLGLELAAPQTLELIPTSGGPRATGATRPDHRLMWWERRRLRRAAGPFAAASGPAS